jgi:hypothetical protein
MTAMIGTEPDRAARALAAIIETRKPLRGIREVEHARYAFDMLATAQDIRAAADSSLALLLSIARGTFHNELCNRVAPALVANHGPAAAFVGTDPDASLRLCTELTARTLLHTARLIDNLLPSCAALDVEPADGELTAFDAILFDYLARVGPNGATIASAMRSSARRRMTRVAHRQLPSAARWALWRFDAENPTLYCGWLGALAETVLIDDVLPDLLRERERRERNHEALAMPVHIEVVRLHSRAGARPNDTTQQLRFDDGTTIDFLASTVAGTELIDASTIKLVSRGIGLLGTLDAHRLLRWEVSQGYARYIAREPNPHVIELPRGYGELAEALGIHDNGAPLRLRALLAAQRSCAFPLPGPGNATGNLIILSEWQGSGRRAGRIRIELGSVLMPKYIYELPHTVRNGRDLALAQKLVPLVAMPPFVGRKNDHGPQATLSMLITRELRIRAEELYRNGAVRIELDRWAELAGEARMPRARVSSNLRALLDAWTKGGNDAPAFLDAKQGRHAYTLSDAHAAARRFLLDAGKREHEGARAGRRSVDARAARRARGRNRR